ncbi:MAG: hypothetical protein DSO02_04395 [Hadesarchaea archaeon]|nr:MAG: hypothetical protein DSO02_04395 [Hadesarchaea archaeon]
MSPRLPLALCLVFVGPFLLLEASTPLPSSLLDFSLLCLGLASILSGFLLVDPPSQLFPCLLMGLGFSLLLQREKESFSETNEWVFLILSFLLFLLAIFSYKLLRPRK